MGFLPMLAMIYKLYSLPFCFAWERDGLDSSHNIGCFLGRLKKTNEPCMARYGIQSFGSIGGTRAWMLNFPLFETPPQPG
jgi:hypothetical protein